ncbi:MAG: hypothetical protein AAGH76_04190 [Pseudomonadota bacterium]
MPTTALTETGAALTVSVIVMIESMLIAADVVAGYLLDATVTI